MIRTLAAIVAIGSLALPANAQPQLKIGDPAPEISVSSYVGAEEGPTKLSELRGKVTVLEFWATWCAPCVAAIPHMNDLAEKFAAEPVVMISISCDDRATVEKFVEKRPFKTLVAVDDAHKTFRAYGRGGIPYTVIVDREGKVAAITTPDKLTESVLRAALAGKPLDLPIKPELAGDLEWAKAEGVLNDENSSLAHAILQRSAANQGTARFAPGSGRIDADGVSLRVLMELAFDIEQSQIVASPGPMDSQIFRVSVLAPGGNDQAAREMLRALLSTSLGLAAEWVEEERMALVLARRTDSPAPQVSKKDQSLAMGRAGTIRLDKGTMKMLATFLGRYAGEKRGGQLGVDETRLTELYDVSLKWTPGDAESLRTALAAYGLEMTVQPRRIKTLHVKTSTVAP